MDTITVILSGKQCLFLCLEAPCPFLCVIQNSLKTVYFDNQNYFRLFNDIICRNKFPELVLQAKHSISPFKVKMVAREIG